MNPKTKVVNLNPKGVSKYSRLLFKILVIVFCNSLPAIAQTADTHSDERLTYSLGTGFFVSYSGHIITNAHVVPGCSQVIIRGTVPSTEAEILKVDTVNDLALLQTSAVPLDIASLSTSNQGLHESDRVVVIGYPGEHSVTGLYKLVESSVISDHGPQGEPGWVQFKSAADHGNSGGPLLDATGNVIGVVQGHVTLSSYDPLLGGTPKAVSDSDVAISLPILMPFLDAAGVPYQRNPNHTQFLATTVENKAKNYIVNVVCVEK